MKVPMQTAADSSSLSDQILAMVEQELDLSALAFQASDRQVRLSQCSPSHGEGVDGVRLAELTNCRHESRLDQDHRLAGMEQIRFQPPRQVSTVLQRPPAVRPPTRPSQSLQVTGRGRRKRLVVELLAVLVDGDERVRAFVGVAPECHHGPVSLQGGLRPGRWTQLSWGGYHAPMKSRRPAFLMPDGRQFKWKPPRLVHWGANPPGIRSMTLTWNGLPKCRGLCDCMSWCRMAMRIYAVAGAFRLRSAMTTNAAPVTPA